MRRVIRFALLALAGLQFACAGALISNKQEGQIGKGVDGEVRKEYRIVDPSDPVAKWAVDFVKPLTTASKSFRNPSEIGGYKVAVIHDDKLVNAFAAPGGFTYIATGLILQASSCAEIAGVMGHELAHVTQRHGAKAMEKAFAAQQLVGFFLGDGLTAEAAATLWGFVQSTKFSREDEAEADSVGLRISQKSGYDPYGLADFFKKLLSQEKGAPPEFLSSHPATDKRIKAVETEIKKRFASAKRGDAAKTRCKTSMSLDDVKARIKSGQMKSTKSSTSTKAKTGSKTSTKKLSGKN